MLNHILNKGMAWFFRPLAAIHTELPFYLQVRVIITRDSSSAEVIVFCSIVLGYSHLNLTDFTKIRCSDTLSQVPKINFASDNQEPHPFA